MKKTLIISFVAILISSLCYGKQVGRWSEEKANAWWAKQEWPVGCNYVPSYAVNQLEWWQKETFDIKLIDHEIGLAEGLGFNSLRIYFIEYLWWADKEGYKERIEQFMQCADRHGMKIIVTLFTNGGSDLNPTIGPQPQPIAGVHSSAWIPNPGPKVLADKSLWPKYEKYVKEIFKTYGKDPRILYWCLYNEPENLNNGAECLPFMREAYKWARSQKPTQPLSSPIWLRPGQSGSKTKLDMISFIGENCDIMTFHCYYNEELKNFILMMKRFNRPLVCQEYMGRPKSTFEYSLPILKENGVGAINWGLVRGKCGFYMPWGSKPGDPMPKIWFHDIFNPDDTPYSQKEVEFIRSVTADKSTAGKFPKE